tara:strand:- start:2540 stop:4480 length:1941 start_codon:yes stop_codon:yes gene_type:complete
MWDKKGENISRGWLTHLKIRILSEQKLSNNQLEALTSEELFQYATARAAACRSQGYIAHGDKSPLVKKIQDVLTTAGKEIEDESGVFGDSTLTAVLSYQKENNLRTDGCVGPETQNSLGLSNLDVAPTIHTGDENVKIRKVIGNAAAGYIDGVRTVFLPDEARIGGTLAWRNNNPGNIRLTRYWKRWGAVGRAFGFASFPTAEAGHKALEDYVVKYGFNKDKYTIETFFDMYCRGCKRYPYLVANKFGVGVDTKMSYFRDNEEALKLFTKQIKRIEGWKAGKIVKELGLDALRAKEPIVEQRLGDERLAQMGNEELLNYSISRADACNSAGLIGFGSKSVESIKKIQQKLKDAGAEITDSEGEFGNSTLAALIAAQKQAGIRTDGCVGPETIQALGIEVEKAPPIPKPEVPLDRGMMKEEIRENNLKYFGNPDGLPGNGWQSSIEDKRYNHKLNYIFGPIPYRGTTEGKPSRCVLHPDWKKDNLKTVSTSIGRVVANKYIADQMAAAIEECRQEYGVPLRSNGAYYKKGRKSGFSTHAWGCAIDLDPYILNPFTKDGMLTLEQTGQVRVGKHGTKRYWKLTNSNGTTWKEYLDSLSPSEKAMPLYVFIAGPRNNNGMAKIFAKHGFPSWGGNWRGAKDNLHFSVFG